MARPGRLRRHDPIGDKISFAIGDKDDCAAQSLIAATNVDILDGYSRTPLIYAAFHNRLQLLKWLIARGAKIDQQDRNGWCALHFCAQERNVDVANVLLDAGAAIEVRDIHGNTPLSTAAFNASDNEGKVDYSVFSALIRRGANLENRNLAGVTVRELAMNLFPDDLEKLIADATS